MSLYKYCDHLESNCCFLNTHRVKLHSLFTSGCKRGLEPRLLSKLFTSQGRLSARFSLPPPPNI